MAKNSGGTRAVGNNSYGLSLGSGTDLPDKLVNNKSDITALYSDFKYNKKAGNDVSDESYLFITKSGKMYYDSAIDENPKGMKMNDVIYIEHQNAMEKLAWYDRSRSEHKKTISKLTGYKVK